MNKLNGYVWERREQEGKREPERTGDRGGGERCTSACAAALQHVCGEMWLNREQSLMYGHINTHPCSFSLLFLPAPSPLSSCLFLHARSSRYGYDHLILKIEWAKPSTKDASGAGSSGLSGGFVSGYGKALPQDVPKS